MNSKAFRVLELPKTWKEEGGGEQPHFLEICGTFQMMAAGEQVYIRYICGSLEIINCTAPSAS